MFTARPAVVLGPQGSQGDLSTVERANQRLLGEARVLLAGVAMTIALLNGAQAYRYVVAALLLGYGAFAFYALFRLARSPNSSPVVSHWADLTIYLVAIALTGGLSSDYVVFLLFPLFASFLRRGLRRALIVALTAVVLLAVIATLAGQEPGLEAFDVSPLVRMALLVAISGIIVRWTHAELTLMRRLAFSNDVSRMFSARPDLGEAIPAFADMLREYHHASACIVLLRDATSSGWMLYESDGTRKAAPAGAIADHLAGPLLALPEDRTVVYHDRRLLTASPSCREYDAVTLMPVSDDEQAGHLAGSLAELLEARTVVSLPIRWREQVIGRIHLMSQRTAYGHADVAFLAQVTAQVGLMIENARLVDRLASRVASEERRKISRDLHDSTIQPYIGLKLALEALQRKAGDHPLLLHEIGDIIKMANDGISHLRNYVGTLEARTSRPRHDSLLPAVRSQAERFSEYYGIHTEVVGEEDIRVDGRLHDHVMHIVREGLSNIRRHTDARWAAIHLSASNDRLVISIHNEIGADLSAMAPVFSPRSITERAGDLGGTVKVTGRPARATVVTIEVPIGAST